MGNQVGVGPTYVGLTVTDNVSFPDVENTFVGPGAGNITLTGKWNVCVGAYSGRFLTIGEGNTLIGSRQCRVTTGWWNTIVGEDAGLYVTTGSNNTMVGPDCCNQVGCNPSDVTVLGYNAGRWLQEDGTVLLGSRAGWTMTTGVGNTVVGFHAYQTASTGKHNTVIGYYAAQFGDCADGTGDDNTVVGYQAANPVTGRLNTALGSKAAGSLAAGQSNVVLGAYAGVALAAVDNNTLVGTYAGYALNAAGCVFLGFSAGFYETVQNTFMVDNDPRASEADARVKALLYGKFGAAPANQFLWVNGRLGVLLSEISAAADNAAAAAAGVAVGQFYRTNADPSVLCVRSA